MAFSEGFTLTNFTTMHQGCNRIMKSDGASEQVKYRELQHRMTVDLLSCEAIFEQKLTSSMWNVKVVLTTSSFRAVSKWDSSVRKVSALTRTELTKVDNAAILFADYPNECKIATYVTRSNKPPYLGFDTTADLCQHREVPGRRLALTVLARATGHGGDYLAVTEAMSNLQRKVAAMIAKKIEDEAVVLAALDEPNRGGELPDGDAW